MWVAFAIAKATHIFFSAKNTCELDIVLTRTVNILTTNKLVKLKMLWTTGPCTFQWEGEKKCLIWRYEKSWETATIYEPCQAKMCIWGMCKQQRMCSVIRAFPVHCQNQWISFESDVERMRMHRMMWICASLREHAYSNILKILSPKNESFQMKNSDIFHTSAQKHRLWVLVRTASASNKKNNVYLCKPQFYYIKVGFKGVKII